MAFDDRRPHRFVRNAVVPALACLGLALLGSACPSDPSPAVDESGSSSTGEPISCTPGQTVACPCLGGNMGVQTCNAQGDGFGPCNCAGTTTVTTTATDTTTAADTDSTTDVVDSTATTTDSTTSSTTSDESTTSGPPQPYGPCFEGEADCELPGEVCVSAGAPPPSTVCSRQACVIDDDCPPNPEPGLPAPQCDDITGEGTNDCYLPCARDVDCPTGMECFLAAGPACVWPAP